MTLSFFSGGGKAGAELRAQDWSAHPLGQPGHWPAALKTMVGVILSSNQPMFVVWGAQRVLLFNDAYSPLLGNKRAGAQGKPFFEVWDEMVESVGPLIDQVFGGTPIHMNDITLFTQRHGHPEEAHFSFFYAPLRDDDDALNGLFCACTEITDQVWSQRAHADELARFRVLFEQSPRFVAVLQGATHCYEMANPAYLSLVGDRDIMGKTVRNALPELAGQGFFELLDTVWQTGLPHIARDVKVGLRNEVAGPLQERYLDFVYQPVRDADGSVSRIFVEGSDVTVAHQARETLIAREAELRQLNDLLEQRVAERTEERNRVWRNSRDLVSISTPDGTLLDVNPAWSTLLGYEYEDLVGRSFAAFVVVEDQQASLAAHHRAQSGPLTNFENRLRHQDGSVRWLSWMTSQENDTIYAYGRDITAEKEAAGALVLAEEQLRQAQKMEAVGLLTGGIAHDFNNLLTGITASMTMLKRKADRATPDDIERYTTLSLQASSKAAALIQRLLAFARRQPLSPVTVEIDSLIADVLQLFESTLGSRIALKIDVTPGIWPVRCDPVQLESALLNIVLNARDAMPGGGALHIATRNLPLGAPDNTLGADHVVVSITDTGEGMPERIIKKVFEPFFTTKPVGQGTGLGLSMVYGFVKQSGGDIQIESRPGMGTRISLLLPRLVADAATPDLMRVRTTPAIPHASVSKPHKQMVVLVVEDEPEIRIAVVDVLQQEGWRVLQAADGAAGLALLQSQEPIDLLLTDVGLPGINGRQLREAAIALRPGMKVMLMTGFVHETHPDEPVELLRKPFSADDLIQRLAQLSSAR